MSDLKQKILDIKEKGEDISLLYVEDNENLRENMKELLERVVPKYFLAEDGQQGLELYKKHKPKILMTDINMPNMSGFEMIQRIKKMNPFMKMIVVSAHNDTDHLMQAIKFGVFRYITKPTKLAELVDALHETVLMIEEEEENILFETQLKDIFNYQNHLVMMLDKQKPTLVNQRFLDFFKKDNLEEFMEEHESLDDLLLEHKEFLYSNDEVSWFDKALEGEGKLFHTKLLDADNKTRHMIMKLRTIPEKDNHTIISFDDITDLDLMKLFDKDAAKNDQLQGNRDSVIQMMKIVFENKAEVKIYNFYKGLSIINKAVLIKATNEELVIKTTFSQLKIINATKQMIISSDIFPSVVLCKKVKKVDFDLQTVTFSEVQFVTKSGFNRKDLRLEIESDATISLFYHETKYPREIKIMDLSRRSIKIEITTLPTGMTVDEMVKISLILPTGQQPLLITTEANIFRLDETINKFQLVLNFELVTNFEEKLKEYLYHRQLALIREFKTMGASA